MNYEWERVYLARPGVTYRDRFAWSLRDHRAARGLSQEELAEATGIPLPTLSRWENALNDARLAAVCTLADYFDVTLDEMAGRKAR